ncbi:MAG TPA: N-acetylmuramoyl-L-alanine amidase [Vicinamibacterales bacterium]|nr:N-acetylmuramoyl-L-alanine amidase [Vicinamibacterales bacterium]
MARSTATLLFALTLVVSATPPPLGAQPPASGLRVLSRDGTRTLATIAQNNQEYVALDDVAAAFGVTVREDRLAGGVTVVAGTRSVIITPDQPVVSVSGRLVSLTAAPLRQGNRWLLPLDFLSRAIGPLLDQRFDLRRPARLLVIGDLRVPRVVARVESGAANVTVTFDATPATSARVVTEAGRLVITYEADALELSVPALQTQEFLQAIQPGDTPTSVRVVVGPKFGTHRATTSQPDASSSRLVIELLPAGTDTAPAPAPVPTPAPADLPPLPLPIPTSGVRTIVIDAGHGGDELGARGAAGTQEKDITLLVARRLRTMIESRLGLRVFLTRDDDRTMILDERSAYANSQKADVFVSIHANAAIRPAMKGAEVYYLSVDRANAEARRMAESSGAVLPALGGGTRAIDLILWETAQARYLEQSSTLAGLVEQALRARVDMSPRAVQQAPFRVLVGANMPAVLVEIGYLSNAEQEQALGTGTYQDQVTQALFEAITQFRAHVERTAGQPQ